PFHSRSLPCFRPRIAHLRTAEDCCIHPPGRYETIAVTPPKIFSKEVCPKHVASENFIHLTRSHRRIRTRSPNDCNRHLVHPYAVRLLQAVSASGSRNPDTAA